MSALLLMLSGWFGGAGLAFNWVGEFKPALVCSCLSILFAVATVPTLRPR